MRPDDSYHIGTRLQHVGEKKASGAPVTPPIVQTSLFVFDTVEELWAAQSESVGAPYAYSRLTNPTLDVVEQKIALLEGAERCKCYASGMGAISSAIMSCVRAGSHVVALDTCYGPTKQFLEQYLPRFNVSTTFVDGLTIESFKEALRPETALVYLESPGSILFRVLDIREIAKLCRKRGITTIFDNSYASPIFQRPIEMGIDIVVHSATKYLGGHSDVVAGALCTTHERMTRLVHEETALFGAALPPFPAWLLMRGLRTLPMRMEWAQKSGNLIAEFLHAHGLVEEVFHVGDPDHAGFALAKSQMNGTSSLLSFRPKFKDIERVKSFVEGLEIFQIGVSWGGFESLCVPIHYHPKDWAEPDWVIRLYLGFEDPKDLMRDLEQSFAALNS